MSLLQLYRRGALGALFALATCAHAADALPQTAAAAPAAAEPALAVHVPGFGVPAAPDQLERTRGGSDGIVTQAALRGTVSGNSANHIVTGGNTIQASSFAGASGIPIVIQNSGANVLIQNATVINLQFQ